MTYPLLALSAYSLFASPENGQQRVPTDSLSGKNYHFFHSKNARDDIEPNLQRLYASSHLAKSKKEGNYSEMVLAYKSQLHQSEQRMHLIYADSMLWAASRSNDSGLLGSAHLTKGMVFYSLKRYTNALDEYLQAYKLITVDGNDDYLAHKAQYNIALIKYYLGYYEEAAELLKDCIAYFEAQDAQAYLQSLHFLGLCHLYMGDLASSTSVNLKGKAAQYRLEHIELNSYFLHSEGINYYFRKRYELSIQNLERSLPDLIGRKDFANESVAYFYIGKARLALGQTDEAIAQFLKVDRIFTQHRYLRPDQREAYEILLKHYEKEGQLEQQLTYINRLLKADRILHEDFKYLSDKLFKEYDTAKLLQEKLRVEDQLAQRQRLLKATGGGLFVILAFLLALWRRHRATEKLYQHNLTLLLARERVTEEPAALPVSRTAHDISPDITAAVLRRLERFELQQKFLDATLSLGKMAQYLHSNPNYVSKILYHHKGKKYLEYVTDLRINYLIDLLQKEPRCRRYSLAALAEASGFLTSKHLSKVFLKKTGTPLVYFVKGLEEQV